MYRNAHKSELNKRGVSEIVRIIAYYGDVVSAYRIGEKALFYTGLLILENFLL